MTKGCKYSGKLAERLFAQIVADNSNGRVQTPTETKNKNEGTHSTSSLPPSSPSASSPPFPFFCALLVGFKAPGPFAVAVAVAVAFFPGVDTDLGPAMKCLKGLDDVGRDVEEDDEIDEDDDVVMVMVGGVREVIARIACTACIEVTRV